MDELSKHDGEMKEKGNPTARKSSNDPSEKQNTPGRDTSKNIQGAVSLKSGAGKGGIEPLTGTVQGGVELKVKGRFVCQSSWTVPFHIGCLVSTRVDGVPCVMVAQPGGTFVCIPMTKSQDAVEESSDAPNCAREVWWTIVVFYYFMTLDTFRGLKAKLSANMGA